jgi:hypothetical protein
MQDTDSAMLNALIIPRHEGHALTDVPPMLPDDQKGYLKRYINTVSVEHRKQIGSIIMTDHKHLANWCNEGTIINMDKLPDQIIQQMYEMLYRILRE